MNILAVATWYPHQDNPAEAPFNADHVAAIRSKGHDVRVIHLQLGSKQPWSHRESGVWEGVSVLRLPLNLKRPSSLVAAARVLSQQMKSADIVHTMAFSSILAVVPSWILRRFRGSSPAWVHTEHWNGVVNPASVSKLWLKLSALRWVLRFPHIVSGVTQQLAGEMQHFARPGASRVVPCVVRTSNEITSARFGEPLRLVSVGGLIPRKRPLRTIETVAWLRDRGIPVQLTWVGEGSERAKCEDAIERLNLAGQVALLGAVDPSEVAQHLAEADLFFLPTEQENFFTSAAEALAAGRAVVATRVGGFSDYADASNSRLVDDFSTESLGNAILEARSAFKSIPADRIAAPIRERFSFDSVGKLFDEAYVAALARA